MQRRWWILPLAPAASGVTIDVPAATITIAALAPVVSAGVGIVVPATEITIAPLAPVVSAGVSIDVPAANIDIAAHAPTVTAGGGAVTGGAWLAPHQVKRLRRRLRVVEQTEGERRRQEMSRLRDTLERAYDGRPLEDLPAGVAEYIIPQAETVELPLVVIDWPRLMADLAAVRSLVEAAQAEIDDEEDAIAVLLAA